MQALDGNYLVARRMARTAFSGKDNYRLVFGTEEGRFGGRGDCNSIMGNYSVTDKGRHENRVCRLDAGLLSRSGARKTDLSKNWTVSTRTVSTAIC